MTTSPVVQAWKTFRDGGVIGASEVAKLKDVIRAHGVTLDDQLAILKTLNNDLFQDPVAESDFLRFFSAWPADGKPAARDVAGALAEIAGRRSSDVHSPDIRRLTDAVDRARVATDAELASVRDLRSKLSDEALALDYRIPPNTQYGSDLNRVFELQGMVRELDQVIRLQIERKANAMTLPLIPRAAWP